MGNHNRFFIRYLEPQIKTYSFDKNNVFIEEDNSGRSNVFSTGEKALYSYSPNAEKAARQGLGGLQGLLIVVAIATLVGISTFSISTNTASKSSSFDFTNLENLSEIVTSINTL